MALTDKLSAIGDAIREKTGKTELLTLEQMPEEIASITTGEEMEPIVLTGVQKYGCAGPIASAYIEIYGDTISTQNLGSDTTYMFYNSTLTKIPFELNYSTTGNKDISYIFQSAGKLESLPKINNCKPSSLSKFCQNCTSLKEIPEDYFDNWDLSYLSGLTSSYSGGADAMFQGCSSLRRLPLSFVQYMNPKINYSYCIYNNFLSQCYVLDEVVNLPIPYTTAWTSSGFQNTFASCARLKNFTFETPDGQPVVVQWKGQSIGLTQVGYATSEAAILNKSDITGITADKRVTDDASYQALKDDPDYWTTLPAYSRYNHDSAVATINSLPDASAYLATAGGANKIYFYAPCGEKTDGGAVRNLTEEEIAVAAAKGWTVALQGS